MGKTNFENLEVYQLSEKLADEIWEIVLSWNSFARETVGKQIVRSARTARGSLYETKHFLRRAYKRNLLTKAQIDKLKPITNELAPRLNAYLRSIGKIPNMGSNPKPPTMDN